MWQPLRLTLAAALVLTWSTLGWSQPAKPTDVAAQSLQRIESRASTVHRMLRRARLTNDVSHARCLNSLVTQMHATLRRARTQRRQLELALERRQWQRVRQLRVAVMLSEEHSMRLRREADQCTQRRRPSGPRTRVSTHVEVDPNLPPYTPVQSATHTVVRVFRRGEVGFY